MTPGIQAPGFDGHAQTLAAPPPDVPPNVQQGLLELARRALAVAAGEADPAKLVRDLDLPGCPDEPTAVFVTLTEDGALRGCIGTLEPDRRLPEAVVSAAISAALDDPRFRPVAAGELPAIHIEISVLGPSVPMVEPSAFEPGVDGVTVELSAHRALLLPEVATEFGWGAPEMLDAVCRKAGLPGGAWRDARTRLRTFRTTRFGGPAAPTGDAKRDAVATRV